MRRIQSLFIRERIRVVSRRSRPAQRARVRVPLAKSLARIASPSRRPSRRRTRTTKLCTHPSVAVVANHPRRHRARRKKRRIRRARWRCLGRERARARAREGAQARGHGRDETREQRRHVFLMRGRRRRRSASGGGARRCVEARDEQALLFDAPSARVRRAHTRTSARERTRAVSSSLFCIASASEALRTTTGEDERRGRGQRDDARRLGITIVVVSRRAVARGRQGERACVARARGEGELDARGGEERSILCH